MFVLATRLTQRDFDGFVAEAPIAIVLVQRRVTGLSFLRPIGQYFSSEYPESVRMAVFDSALVATPVWLTKRVCRSPLGSTLTLDNGRAPQGYYLFKSGQPIAYHSGRPPPRFDPSSANALLVLADVLGNSVERQAQAVIDHFEDALALDEAGEEAPQALPDPYSILGVERTASDRDVKVARDQVARSYHPDRIDDMAAELRDLATKRTQEINWAYTEIMRQRGKRQLR